MVEVFRPVERIAISQQLRADIDSMVKLRAANEKLQNPLSMTPKPVSWLQLAKAGTWRGHSMGEFTFDAKVFDQIAANFAKSLNHRIPLDFEHASEAGFEGSIAQRGAPAQGWITELRYSDDALEGKVEWNEGQPGMGYVRDGAYMFLSPAVIFESIDRQSGKAIGAELTSAAMTNRPFLDGLKPLAARHTAPGTSMTHQEAQALIAKTATTAPVTVESIEALLMALPPEFIKNAKKKKKKGSTEPGAKEDEGDGKPFDDDAGGEEEEGDETEMKRCSALAHDARVHKMAAEEFSYAEMTGAICDALNKMFGSWSCYVVAVYDGHVVYDKGGTTYDIGYSMKKGDVKLVGEPQEVRRIYKPVKASAVTSTEGEFDMSKVNEALGLKAEANEASQLSALKGIEEKTTKLAAEVTTLTAQLKLRDEHIASILKTFELPVDASVGDVAKKVTELTAATTQLAALKPEIDKFRAERIEFESKVAEAEINWLCTRGKDYGFPGLERAAVSLRVHRQHSPAEFAATYKPALDGMQAGDKPELFSRITAPGAPLAAPAPAPTTPGQDANSEFETMWKADMAEAKKTGVELSQSDAMSAAAKRLMTRGR